VSAIADKVRQLVDEAVDQLSDYADTVIVIVHMNNPEGDDTERNYSKMTGSQYTRYAILKERVLTWEQYVRTYADHEQKKDMDP